MAKKRVLFVCTANQQRSPTAEALFKDSATVEAKSCGTSPFAAVKVRLDLIGWADEVICMEDVHQTELRREFPDAGFPPIRVLDIPDIYARHDPHLILQLRMKLRDLLG
jgi:predicted protein tyrosine phosphatase